jgi:hypothetical protein
MKKQGLSQVPSAGSACVGRLARFFPEAVPVRIPVHVSKTGADKSSDRSATPSAAEHTVIEFGTPGEVLFASGLPLDFEDTVRVKNADGSLDVEAEVVAMHLVRGQAAVAARFLNDVSNWIIKK